jgi:methionyl aminopeptidase
MLKNGLCIAIEPMITMGSRQVFMDPDRWTIRTRDGKPAAHYEHSLAVRQGRAEVLSSFDEIEKILGDKAI